MDIPEHDVIVVGAGNAATCAVLSAREHGARVLMLELRPEAQHVSSDLTAQRRELRSEPDGEGTSSGLAWPINSTTRSSPAFSRSVAPISRSALPRTGKETGTNYQHIIP
jgi:glycine/D-amino acid oxidase-like deaminating enzyme